MAAVAAEGQKSVPHQIEIPNDKRQLNRYILTSGSVCSIDSSVILLERSQVALLEISPMLRLVAFEVFRTHFFDVGIVPAILLDLPISELRKERVSIFRSPLRRGGRRVR